MDDSKTNTDQVFTIVVSELNLAPTSIALSNNSLSENITAPYVIGSFFATDAESTDTHTFALVSGTGGDNNDNFSIDGSNLLSLIEFNFETQTSHKIRVEVTDNAGNHLVQPFSINILDDSTEDTDNDGLTEAQEDALGTSDV
ncbi:MAG: cadherin repeat domain-containing protein, partial [Opitutae bacterium]